MDESHKDSNVFDSNVPRRAQYLQMCKYHTSNDVFSRCISVAQNGYSESDDDLIQYDTKMRIGTRSVKFKIVDGT